MSTLTLLMLALARVQHDPDHDAAALSLVQRVEDNRVGERAGREVD